MLFHVLFFPLVLGVYSKRATAPGAVAGIALGPVTSLGWILIAGSMFTEPEWLWALGPGTLGGVVMVLVSLLTQKSHPTKPLVTTEGKVLKWPEQSNTIYIGGGRPCIA